MRSDLLQISIMLWSLVIMAFYGGLLGIVLMAIIKSVTKDKAYFTKKINSFMED